MIFKNFAVALDFDFIFTKPIDTLPDHFYREISCYLDEGAPSAGFITEGSFKVLGE